MQRIRGTQTFAGTTAAGIICNGGQHFYTGVEIYENGTANCWELVDLQELRQKIASGWLTCRVPERKTLSVHGLGAYTISNAAWLHDANSYYRALIAKGSTLNPKDDRWKKAASAAIRTGSLKGSVPVLPSSLPYGSPVEGRGLRLFRRRGERAELCDLILYADGRAALYGEKEEIYDSLEKVFERFDRGELTARLEWPAEVVLPGLGTAIFAEALYEVDNGEKRKEIEEEMTKAQGREMAFEACKKAYVDYLIEPREWARKRLKEAYEKVPEHNRMFLGSMDDKDSDYRRIIYFPHDKREV